MQPKALAVLLDKDVLGAVVDRVREKADLLVEWVKVLTADPKRVTPHIGLNQSSYDELFNHLLISTMTDVLPLPALEESET